MAHLRHQKTTYLATWNANGGLKQKSSELLHFMKEHNLAIMLITETHLLETDKWNLANMAIYRSDRPGKRRGGGTAIVIQSNVNHHQLPTPNLKTLEAVQVQVQSALGPLNIVSAYGRPNQKLHTEDISALLQQTTPTIIAGDLNAKHRSWNSRTNNNRGMSLYKHSQQFNYVVAGPIDPTHHPSDPHKQSDILDIAILNNVKHSVEIETISALTSDHDPVIVRLGDEFIKTPPRRFRRYDKADWELYRQTLDTIIPDNLSPIETPADVDSRAELLVRAIEEATSASIPTEESKPNTLFDLPPDIIAHVKTKNQIRRTYHKYKTKDLKSLYNKLTKALKLEIQAHRQHLWEKSTEKLNFKDHSIWNMSRRLQRKPVPDPPIQGSHHLACTPADKANVLASTLATTFTNNPATSDSKQIVEEARKFIIVSPPPQTVNKENLCSKAELLNFVKKAKTRKAPGHDLINKQDILELSNKAGELFLSLINGIITTHHFPTIWKKAKIITFLKPGKPPRQPSSYRPISLLSTLSKITEKVILRRIQDHLTENNILPDEQFGFRAHHSTQHQLLRVTERITDGFNRQLHSAAVFLDIEKAFDKVWHLGLIAKMIYLKFPSYLIYTIKSFLEDRSFYVSRQNAVSSTHPLLAGVPQGSSLSPVLFNIFTYDLPQMSQFVQKAVYADDITLIAQSRRASQAVIYLQTALDQLSIWYEKWRIAVNPSKTQAILFGRGRQSATQDLLLKGKVVQWSSSYKYLGLHLDRGLRWTQHINEVLSRANGKLASLYPLFKSRNLKQETKLQLYKTILLPTLSYAAPIWAGCASQHSIHDIQVYQNKIIRIVMGASIFTRIADLHDLAHMETISEHFTRIAQQFYASLVDAQNPKIRVLSLSTLSTTAQDRVQRPSATLNMRPSTRKRKLSG